MELDDRASIRTPEGLELEMTLAGLGSRFGAAIIDSLILGVLLILAALGLTAVGSALSDDLAMLFVGAVSLTVFLLLLGYFVAFEVGNGGRTPGKAAFGIRVVSVSGEPLGFWSSLVRNLIRVVDFLPSFYVVGAVSILASERNQRLGDLAGRTMVVRDRLKASVGVRIPSLPLDRVPWDVSSVSPDEVGLVRRFLERSRSLTPDRREQLAAQIAGRLRPKVTGPDRPVADEDFLLRVLAEKLERER